MAPTIDHIDRAASAVFFRADTLGNAAPDSFSHCNQNEEATALPVASRGHNQGKIVYSEYDLEAAAKAHVICLEQSCNPQAYKNVMETAFSSNQNVLALCCERRKWQRTHFIRANCDGSYQVKYTDS